MLFYSKGEIHSAINSLHSPFFDVFFKRITFGGNGLMYLLPLLYLLKGRNKWLIAYLVAVVSSVALVFLFKHCLFEKACRPVKYFEMFSNLNLYLVDGVRLSRLHSFPSGHTTTAFTVFFIFAVMMRKNSLKLLCFIFALLVAYSRMYLSQHFLIDIVAGSFFAVGSAMLSIRYSMFLFSLFERIVIRVFAKKKQIFWK